MSVSLHPIAGALRGVGRRGAHVPGGASATLGAIVAACLCTGAGALLVARFDAAPVLGALLALGGVATVLVRPQWAVPAVVFVLYTNIPVLATHRGVSPVAASAFMLLLGLPILHHTVWRGERLRLDATFALMIAYLGILLVSAFQAKGPEVASEYIWTYVIEGLLLYWLVINAVRTRAVLQRVIWTLLAAGALLGALATYQELTGNFHHEFGGLAQRNVEYLQLQQMDPEDPATREMLLNYDGGRATRAKGPMREPNRFAQVLLVLLPLALLAYRTAASRPARLAATGMAALILGGMVFTDSRGAFAILVVLGLLAWHLRWVRRTHLLLGAVVTSLLVAVLAPRYVARVVSIVNVTALAEGTSSRTADGAIRGRATQMLAAGQVFLEHPLLGVGPGQYTPFYALEYQSRDPRLQFRDIDKGRRAHSLYFEMAAEVGIIGLGTFLAIFGLLLRALHRARRRWLGVRPELADLATAFGFSLLAFLGTSAFLHLAFQRYHWFLVALASAALAVLRAAEREPAPASAAPARSGA